MLDIIITHYKEPYEVGEKLFQIIGLQRCVDFDSIRVMVINDGGQRLPEDKLNALPYRVEQHDIPHGGISAARNAGIELATGKWIMFCDFDDTLMDIYSLREYMSLTETDDYDMLWSSIVAEDYIDGKKLLYYVPEKQRFVFCHGKIYRREFLIENNIRFDESLVFNEDSCFNAVIVAHTHHTRIGEIRSRFPLYTWVRRENSVTNSGREDEATYGHFRRNMIVTSQYDPDDIRYNGMVTRSAYDAYYMVFGKRNSMQMRRRIVDEFSEWIADRLNAFGKVEPETMDEIRKISRMELVGRDEIIPDSHEVVRSWVEHIAKTYRNLEVKNNVNDKP